MARPCWLLLAALLLIGDRVSTVDGSIQPRHYGVPSNKAVHRKHSGGGTVDGAKRVQSSVVEEEQQERGSPGMMDRTADANEPMDRSMPDEGIVDNGLDAQMCSLADPSCCDSNASCDVWASLGECRRNPRWMGKNCRHSCKTCGGSSSERGFDPSNGRCPTVISVQAETRHVFSFSQVRARMQQLGCAEAQIPPDCSVNTCYNDRYRSLDGTCNNRERPAAGASFSAYSRLLPPAYDDGINTLVSSVTRRRPNARELSMFLLTSSKAISSTHSSMVMQFGQFLSHDITSLASTVQCTCTSSGPRCANVPMPPSDFRGFPCIPFTRSFQVCGTGVGGSPREQLNENTAFIDGSTVYGSESVTGRTLRVDAMLKSIVINGRPFPPNNGRDTMTAGDDRATLFLGLAAMHTTFLRMHNNIAARLTNMNRHWRSDRVFQETRKIIGATIQAIAYQEFLPKLLGPFFKQLVPTYAGYKSHVNPSIINEFAAAAYRLHGMVQERYPLVNERFENVGEVPFVNGVNHIESVLSAIDNVYRGFISIPSRFPQRITTSVTEKLFGGQGDMATFNIQRGRDHGLRPYNEYRKLCGLDPITDFNRWAEVSDAVVRKRVSDLYKSPDDIDLYVGGVLEEPKGSSMVGPTFACIIAEQFTRLRDGDRFFYENQAVFSSAQRNAIKQQTLSGVLCATGDSLSRITPTAFEKDNGEKAVSCSNLPKLDLEPWRE